MLIYVHCVVYRERSAVFGENPVIYDADAGTGYLGDVSGTGRNILFPSIARPHPKKVNCSETM
jgi:hypothetical protein